MFDTELKCSRAAIVWFPDPSCVGGVRVGREGRVW